MTSACLASCIFSFSYIYTCKLCYSIFGSALIGRKLLNYFMSFSIALLSGDPRSEETAGTIILDKEKEETFFVVSESFIQN